VPHHPQAAPRCGHGVHLAVHLCGNQQRVLSNGGKGICIKLLLQCSKMEITPVILCNKCDEEEENALAAENAILKEKLAKLEAEVAKLKKAIAELL